MIKSCRRNSNSHNQDVNWLFLELEIKSLAPIQEYCCRDEKFNNTPCFGKENPRIDVFYFDSLRIDEKSCGQMKKFE